MPLANLINKVKLQQLFKNIYKTNLNVKCLLLSFWNIMYNSY